MNKIGSIHFYFTKALQIDIQKEKKYLHATKKQVRISLSDQNCLTE